MNTLSSRRLRLSPVRRVDLTAREINRKSADDLIEGLSRASQIRLRLQETVHIDATKAGVLLGVLARIGDVSVQIEGKNTEKTRRSLARSFLRVLDQPNAESLQAALSTTPDASIRIEDPDNQIVITRPAELPTASRDRFHSVLSRLLANANIRVPAKTLGPLSQVGFEAVSNAEEYGALDESGKEISRFRLFATRIGGVEDTAFAPNVSRYLSTTFVSHHSSPIWLEMLVVDNGVGMTYPSYRLSAEDAGRTPVDIYELDAAIEFKQLGLILNKSQTTKGSWGRILNRETQRGEGTRLMLHRLASLRGFASVRTGRTAASWGYSKAHLEAAERGAFEAYDVEPKELGLYRGTVWHIVVPLEQQLGMSLGRG